MPTMNAKYLGAFLLLATQIEWADHVFGSQNPDFSKFTDVGLSDTAFQKEFYANFTKNDNLTTIRQQIVNANLTDPQQTPGMKDIHHKLFNILVQSLAENAPSYSPPPCPSRPAVESIIDAVNNA
jgi:hypothetical protein